MLQQGDADQAVYLHGGVVGGQVGLCDGHLFGYPGEVGKVAIPSEWCSKSPARCALRRRADHVDHRQVFGVTAGHPIQRAQLPTPKVVSSAAAGLQRA